PPHAVRALLDGSGARIDPADRERPARVFGRAETYLVTSALRGAVERGTGRGVRAAGYRGPVAAKSGTTNDTRDAWFVGYTPEIAAGVWIGHDDGSPLGRSGSGAALPVFARFLESALGADGDAAFRIPEGVEIVDVNPETGQRAGWGCYGEPELFLVGTAPERACDAAWPAAWDEEIRAGRRFRESLEGAQRWLERALRDLMRRRARVQSGGG
ncbi:MAG: penicillin-binding transpeptidase domain-containing protein, partial [Gemmatimonadota bacterium]